MAATALLRSIRRRDVVSAPLSVYKSATQEKPKTKERKELIDTKNTYDKKIYNIGKSLGEYGEKIPSEVTKEIEDAVADLRSVSSRDDLNKINAKIDAANKALSKIGEHMSGGFGGGSAPGGGTQGGSDQAPEAEYEEVLKNKIVKYLRKVVKWLKDLLYDLLVNVIVFWILLTVWRWILWLVWDYKSKHVFDIQPVQCTKPDLEVKQLRKEVDELKSKR